MMHEDYEQQIGDKIIYIFKEEKRRKFWIEVHLSKDSYELNLGTVNEITKELEKDRINRIRLNTLVDLIGGRIVIRDYHS